MLLFMCNNHKHYTVFLLMKYLFLPNNRNDNKHMVQTLLLKFDIATLLC